MSVENFDVYENRVINTFLINAVSFLNSIKSEYTASIDFPPGTLNSEYVRFDHTMAKFSKMVLDVKIKEIDNLITKASELS